MVSSPEYRPASDNEAIELLDRLEAWLSIDGPCFNLRAALAQAARISGQGRSPFKLKSPGLGIEIEHLQMLRLWQGMGVIQGTREGAKMLYEEFDKFLAIDTWHTRHFYDEERFFIALAKVVRDPQFNPDTLGDYMRQKKGVSRDDEDGGYSFAIRAYVAAAWAVKGYLKANRL